MRRIALVIRFWPDRRGANAKMVELFGKGDFEGIAQLYTVDAAAFPPG